MVAAYEMLETAFIKLKKAHCDSVSKLLRNPDKPFVVETEPRNHSLRAVVLQMEG